MTSRRSVERRLNELEAGLGQEVEELPLLSLARMLSAGEEWEHVAERNGHHVYQHRDSGELRQIPPDMNQEILDMLDDDRGAA